MNELAQQCLEAVWKDTKKSNQRKNPDHFLGELYHFFQAVQYAVVEERANHFWILYPTDQLQKMFDEQDAFSFDVSDQENDPYAMAWQMAISDYEINPPPLPEFTEREVEDWVHNKNHPIPQLSLL